MINNQIDRSVSIGCPIPVMNNSQRASETQSITTLTRRQKKALKSYSLNHFNHAVIRHGGLDTLKSWIDGLITHLSDPKRRVPKNVAEWVNQAISFYEKAVKANIGMPTYSDSVTLQKEAPSDIPTLPLDGYQLVKRVCLVEKLANSGTTAGGFYAVLLASDLADFAKSTYYRVSKVSSWTGTLPNTVGTSFAGVSVPGVGPAGGTEIMPIWSENWTPVGRGFAGIVTTFPLGDFPQYATNDSTAILNHFTALGGTGGVAGIPVIFHVEIECLV